MPALPKLKIDALAELARQLRFESPDAARRQLERAEALILEILAECGAIPRATPSRAAPSQHSYPLDYIVFRITGMRPDSAESTSAAPVVLEGESLLADLPALIERLSAAARLTRSELSDGSEPIPQAGPPNSRTTRPSLRSKQVRQSAAATMSFSGPWLTLDQLSARWSVGRKTIERLRRRGLPARRVRTGGPGRGAAVREMLVFSETAIRAFEAAGGRTTPLEPSTGQPRSQTRAARAPRLTARDRDRIIARARRYHARFGWSLNRCAARIAASTGRAHETIRRVLRTHDAVSPSPIFSQRGPLNSHERAVLERARRSGASPTRLAERVSRSRAVVYRISAERRTERLGALDLDAPHGPMYDRPDAAEVLLAPSVVRSGLGDAAPETIGELVALCDAMDPPAAGIETARAVAYGYLRHRARQRVRELPRHDPSAHTLDAIETDLRWASRIKADLVRSQLPIALRSIRARLDGRGPESLAPRGTTGGPVLIDACIAAIIDAVDRFDPFKALASGGRLTAPAAIAVNRALTRWLQAAEQSGRGVGTGGGGGGAPRASHKSESAALTDWTLRVDAWQEWLEPPEVLVRTIRATRSAPPPTKAAPGRASDATNTLLMQMRFGFLPTGAPPMTIADTARALGIVPQRVSARERLLIAAAIRGGSGPEPAPRSPSARRRGRNRD